MRRFNCENRLPVRALLRTIVRSLDLPKSVVKSLVLFDFVRIDCVKNINIYIIVQFVQFDVYSKALRKIQFISERHLL